MSVSSDADKANPFSQYFANDAYSSVLDTLPFHTHISEIVKKIKISNHHSSITHPCFRIINAKELKSTLKYLSNSAPGPENVHNRCLKNFTNTLVDHLLKLLNATLMLGYVPQS